MKKVALFLALPLLVWGGAVSYAQSGRAEQRAQVSQEMLERALRAYEEERLDDAERTLKRLLDRHPRSVAVLNNLAVIALAREDSDAAIALLRRALETDHAVMTTYLNLTAVYERKAAEAYRRALSANGKAEPLTLSLITTLDAAPARGEPAPVAPRGEQIAREIIESEKTDTPFVDDPPPAQAAKAAKAKAKAAAKKAPKVKPPAAEGLSEEQEDAIVQALNRWADAWSSRDLEGYYRSYTRRHAPRRMSHEEWKKFRAERLTAPKSIEVRLVDFAVTNASKNKAQVEFVQQYRSNLLRSDSLKRLYLVREDDDWKIAREIVLRRLK